MDNNKISYMLAPITNKTPSYAVSIEDIHTAIKDPENYKKATKTYRRFLTQGDDAQAKERKNSDFDYVTFSGKFKYVSNNNLIEHSGLICIDIDKLQDETSLTKLKAKLLKDPVIDTAMLFISPSGNGLKWVIKIQVEKDNVALSHLDFFKSISFYIKNAYSVEIDQSCKDLARACYLPYDKDCYYNPEAKPLTQEFVNTWKPQEELPKPLKKKKVGGSSDDELTPWDDYNRRGELGELLVKHGWSFVGTNSKGDMYLRPGGKSDSTNKYSAIHFRDSNLLYVHSSSTNLNLGENTPAKVFCTLETGGDWSEASRALKKKGFGKQKTTNTLKIVKDKDKTSEVSADLPVFWKVDKNKNYTILRHDYVKFLEDYFHYAQVRSYGVTKLVKIKGKILYEADELDVVQDTRDFIDKLDPELANAVNPAMMDLLGSIKHKILTTYIKVVNSEMLRETPENAYFYFRNKLLEVTKDAIIEKDYEDLDFYIWDYQILERDWQGLSDFEKANFYDFLFKVSGQDEQRFESLRSVIGFLLHSYKDVANAKAVMFIDEFNPDRPNEMAANGGTGKSTLVNCLSHIKKLTKIDGKTLNPDSQFAFSSIKSGDKIVFIDDIKKDFKFDSLFVKITNDLQIEKKFENSASIPFSESPKFIIAGNKALKTDGGESDSRRLIFFEFAPYFSKEYTPIDEYNERFCQEFSWDTKQWQEFDAMMINFVQEYLQKGLIDINVSYEYRELLESIGPEVLEFLDENIEQDKQYTLEALVNGDVTGSGGIKRGFRQQYDEYKISKKDFLYRFRKWCIFKGYKLALTRTKKSRYYYIERV